LAPRDKIARVNHDARVAFAHGLSILVFAAAFGEISGGRFYLAVTIGLATAGGFQAVASRLTLSPKSPAASPPGCYFRR
jgi:glycerol uptake facilitator-like aquaporin